jgi:hypothetical protein
MENYQYGNGGQYNGGWGFQGWEEENRDVTDDGDPQASGPHNPNPSGRGGLRKCARCRRLKIKVMILNECPDRSARA